MSFTAHNKTFTPRKPADARDTVRFPNVFRSSFLHIALGTFDSQKPSDKSRSYVSHMKRKRFRFLYNKFYSREKEGGGGSVKSEMERM